VDVLRFSVRDTGIGIPADRIGAVFAPFEQADGSTTRKYGGTGLGLSISARLAEMMGGRLCVESEVGRGSTFRFTASFGRPVEAAGSLPRGTSAREPRAGWTGRPLRVLLAEDNAVNQRLAVRLLEKAGHTVTVAANGQLALDALGQGSFDVVFMDLQMPEMGGFEATQFIRRGEGPGRCVPIIAMTAHAMKGDREYCLQAGMDGYVSKPVQSDALWAELKRVLS
jgi:CheY-like chemotaxis protein